MYKQEKEGEEDKNNKGEVTPPRNPHEEAETPKKRKVSPMKPTSQKKSKESKPKLQILLLVDDFDFIIAVVSYSSEDILQKNEAKHQALHSSPTVPTMQPPPKEPKLGDETAHLRRIAGATEARLRRMQE